MANNLFQNNTDQEISSGFITEILPRSRYKISTGGVERILPAGNAAQMSIGDRVTLATTGDGTSIIGRRQTKDTGITEVVVDG